MSSSKPYHEWARNLVDVHSTTGLPGIPSVGSVYPLANVFVGNQADDLVERVFLDVTVSALLRPTSGDVTWSNDWPARVTWIVCAAVEAISSGVMPNPIDQFGPTRNIVLTGSLHLVGSGIGAAPDAGFLAEPWAVWFGSFESQGVRSSPVPGTGPAVQATLRGKDDSGMLAGEPLAPLSDISIYTYARALFASRVPY